MADKRKVNPQNVFAAMKYLVDHRGEPYKKVAEGLEQEGFTWTIQDARYYREDHPVNGSAADGLKYADVGAGLETVANCYSNKANYEATQHYLFDAPKGEKTPAEVFVQRGFELGWAPDFDGDKDSSLVLNGKNVPVKDGAEVGGVVKFENDVPSKSSPLDSIEYKKPTPADGINKSGTKSSTMSLDIFKENESSMIKLSKEDAAKELSFDISVTDADGKIVPPSSGFMSGLRGAMGSREERSHMIDYLKMKDDVKNLQNKDTDGPDVT